MKKIICVFCSIMLLFGLCACGDSDDKTTDNTPDAEITLSSEPDEITNVSDVTTETHVKLIPLNEDEVKTNLYYVEDRTESEARYKLVTEDGSIMYIPIDSTVIYLGDAESEAYVERISFSYDRNGVAETTQQYWLYVPDTTGQIPNAEPTLEVEISYGKTEDVVDIED